MVFFNDPMPILDPAARAVQMAMAMREAAGTLIADWRKGGRDLGFGAGIAQGYATLGLVWFHSLKSRENGPHQGSSPRAYRIRG
jgi:adenylate cyclase